MRWRRWTIIALVVLGLLLVAGSALRQTWRVGEVSGVVVAEGRPLAGAVVRVKATGFESRTDEQGRFTLTGFPSVFSVPVTAWSDGYYIGGESARPWKRRIEIALERHLTTDNPNYAWVPPSVDRSVVEDFLVGVGLSAAAKLSFNRAFLPLSSRLALGCANCHGRTVHDQWAASSHAQGTSNIRFMTMYNGTDVHGNSSPPTRYGTHREYGRFPLRPDPEEPYFGPGFKLDFPEEAGSCATCHAPTAALTDPYGADINAVEGTDSMGVHCDFCHKVVDVRVDPITQRPHENTPGVISMELRRPDVEPQIFFGPYDDVDVGPDTFLPLQDESRFCAACHDASFWGTPIYQSYAEWLASPYPQEGETCQTCHMKPDGLTRNFAPGRGGVERDPETIFTHSFPGAADVALLQDTAKLEASAHREGDRVLVEVSVTNEKAGHHIPTDHPMRNILLVVSVTDAQGTELGHLGDQVLPDWTGVGDEPDDYAGRPGKGYAKILEELWTEVSPTAAYWNPTVLRTDTRIPARATDVTHYEFRAPGLGEPIVIEARLVFRRAFKDLAEQKGWVTPDILMEVDRMTLP